MKNDPLPLGMVLFCLIIGQLPYLFKGIDGFHAWRQGDTASTARNFYEESPNIFFPRIDVRGDTTGITGMEFPLYQYTVSLFYHLFQKDHEFFGLLVSLISYIMIFFFLRILFPNIEQIYLLGSFISVSILFKWAHKFMPETFGLALSLGGLILYSRKKTLTAQMLLLLGALTKPFFIFFFLPVLWDFVSGLAKKVFLRQHFFGGLASLIIFSSWYFWWSPYISDYYGIGQYFYFLGNISWKHIFLFVTLKHYLIVAESIAIHYLSPLFIVSFMLGLGYIYKKCEYHLYFYIALLCLFIIPLVSDHHFHVHPYFLMALVPFVVLANALGISIIGQRLQQKSFVFILVSSLITLVFVCLVLLLGLKEQGQLLQRLEIMLRPFLFFLGVLLIGRLRHVLLENSFFKNYESSIFLGVLTMAFFFFWLVPHNAPKDIGVRKAMDIVEEVQAKTRDTDLFLTNDPGRTVAYYKTKRKGFHSWELKNLLEKDYNGLRKYFDKGVKWILFYNGREFKLIPMESALNGPMKIR